MELTFLTVVWIFIQIFLSVVCCKIALLYQIEPLINAWDRINPFKKARERMTKKVQDSKEGEIDRDNVEIPFVLEEKRIAVTSDPGVPDHTNATASSTDAVLTMKKVSSLGLV